LKIKSWEQVGLDQKRAVAFALSAGASFFAAVAVAGQLLQVGSAGVALGLVAGAGAGYMVSTAPRRFVGKAGFEQTIEAPSFAASSNIYVKSTSSQSKTFLMLRADEKHLRSFLFHVRKQILLGYDASSAVRAAKPQSHIFSESVRSVLNSVAGVARARVEEGGEELDGILNSSGLDEETKMPLLIAVSFFLPIMLMLFAATAKGTGPVAMAALVVLEVVILDITLAVSGSSVAWGRAQSRTGGEM
jgi:hypothetical protein